MWKPSKNINIIKIVTDLWLWVKPLKTSILKMRDTSIMIVKQDILPFEIILFFVTCNEHDSNEIGAVSSS